MPERVEGAQTPYEVYCYRCRVTFPVGTRRCIHCGGRVGQRPELAFGSPIPSPPSAGAPAGVPGAPTEEDEELGAVLLKRFGGLGLWALMVLGALLLNLCSR